MVTLKELILRKKRRRWGWAEMTGVVWGMLRELHVELDEEDHATPYWAEVNQAKDDEEVVRVTHKYARAYLPLSLDVGPNVNEYLEELRRD